MRPWRLGDFTWIVLLLLIVSLVGGASTTRALAQEPDRIEPNDVLSIRIYDGRKAEGVVSVQPDGTIAAKHR